MLDPPLAVSVPMEMTYVTDFGGHRENKVGEGAGR